jgi:hypothetical protein
MAMDVRIVKGKPAPGGSARFWQEKDNKSLARKFIDWCNRIESLNWDRRWELFKYYRYLTGQTGYYTYSYSSVSRPASVTNLLRSKFTAPVKNIMGMAYSSLNNRVYKNHVALQVCPDAGNNDAVLQSKKQTRYLDAFFADGMWPLVEECGLDSACTGSGFLKIDTGFDGKSICKTVIKPDEVIVDPAEASINHVTTLGLRLFVNKYELADVPAFAEYRDAILKAPSAELGFANESSVDLTDVIVLRQGYHLGDDDQGVTVLALDPDICLKIDRAALERFPVAKLTCQPLGFWGKGLVQDSLPMQRAHDRISRAIEENMIRFAWPKALIPNGSGINEGEIAAASSLFIHHNPNMPPGFVTPTAITPDQFRYQENLEQGILNLWGVSEQQAAMKPLGADASGRARLAQDQIDDRRNVQLLQNLEMFIEDAGYLAIEAMRKIKPKMIMVGKAKQEIDYPKFEKTVKIRAFPISNIPQSVAGKQDWIDRAFRENRISKETKTRLEGMPDIDGEIDLLDAGADLVIHTLDQIVEEGKYIPPTGIGNLQEAYEKTAARIQFEIRRKVIDDTRLSQLWLYLSAIDELMGEATAASQPAAPTIAGPPQPGAGPTMPGAAAGPSPTPIAPGAAPEAPTLPAAFPGAT